MHTYFISDLHLSDDRPDILEAFLRFLSEQAPSADALYILGDLFELWIGDDDESPTSRQVAQALSALAEVGVPCYFIHGNRDFMIGREYASQAKLIILDEETCINLYGHNTLLLHGDTLCTNDFEYQAYRRRVQQPWLQRLFRILPLGIRQHLGSRIRNQSHEGKTTKTLEMMDVNDDEVSERFKRLKLDWMIHGHTHRPAIHEFPDPNLKRIVLGDWYKQRSILTVTPDGAELKASPLELPSALSN